MVGSRRQVVKPGNEGISAMKTAITILNLAALLAITGCSSTANLQVRTSHLEGTDFSVLHTFRMSSEYPAVEYQRYARGEQLAREVIEQELEARGYERIIDGTPHFRVGFETIFRGHKTRHVPGGETRADSPPAAASGYSRSATLIIRILHPTTGQVLWEGTVSGFRVDPIDSREDMRKAAWRLLAEFPPLS